MTYEWISAAQALTYLSDKPNNNAAKQRICERAHAGLLAAKAERLIIQGNEQRHSLIPSGFWSAEGHAALQQEWDSGDFSIWADDQIERKAFGVSFDFGALSDLVPADQKADALRRISVAGHADWISAAATYSAVILNKGPSNAVAELAEACRLGWLGARAMRATFEERRGQFVPYSAAVEWDVPLWFWRDYATVQKGIYHWSLNKVTGEGRGHSANERIILQGVHFHKSGLDSLGIAVAETADESGSESRAGRPPTYDWAAASNAVWGEIVRGDLQPKNQAMVEKAFQRHLRKGDLEPSESTVRPYAKLIWDEYQKA